MQILPLDGVLVFPENAEVNLTTGAGNEACPGKGKARLMQDPIMTILTLSHVTVKRIF